MFELLRNIHHEQELLEQDLLTEDEQLNFYRDFFKKYHCKTLKNLETVSDEELAIALILANNPELDYNRVKNCVQNNKEIFGGNRTAAYQTVDVLCSLSRTGKYHKIAKRFALGPAVGAKDLFAENGSLLVAVKLLLSTLNIDTKNFSYFMELLYDYSEPVQRAINIIYELKKIRKDRDDYYIQIAEHKQEQIDEYGYAAEISERQADRLVKKAMNELWNIDVILEPLKKVREYYEKKEQEQKSRIRNNKKLQAAYQTLEQELYEKITSKSEIKNASRLLEKIPNEQIRLQALRIIYEHNQSIYRSAQSEYETLSANATSRYQVLLAKYGISPGTYEVGTVMNNSINDLEAMLQKLKSLDITEPESILRIVKTSDLETITNYETLIDKGIISRDLVVVIPSLFNPKSKEYENFMRNLSLIKEEKLNPYAFKESEQVLTTSSKQFKQGIDTLKTYNLLGQIRTGLDYTFLSLSSLQTGIDTMLELGLEEVLTNSIELLNYKDRFKRLQLLKSLNLPVTTKEEVIEVLQTDKFIVPDDEIDNYIYNAAQHNLPTSVVQLPEPKKRKTDISKLDDFIKTDLTYEVGGVTFSRPKVQRTLDSIESSGKLNDRLLYGLINNTTLSDQELVAVTSAIYSKRSQGPVKVKQ